ncbi:MAG: hypothetical protein JXA11_10390 [Phycisphaerae bacterium]|nr:hypothetical protein [Phycisphaerae bacterium]
MIRYNDFKIVGNVLKLRISPKMLGFSPARVWNPSPDNLHRTEPYDVPQRIEIGMRTTATSAARYSPAPYAVVVQNDTHKALIAVSARRGWHQWSFASFDAAWSGVTVKLDLEGRTPPEKACKHIRVNIIPAENDETNHELLARGLALLYPPTKIKSQTPDWWHRPIYCGWGDQVGISMHLESPQGCLGERHALAYCTQGLYTKWLERLEAADVPIGTVIVDAGWSDAGVWTPYPNHWPDLRGFIDGQHKKGRKVLLWIATWFHEGLPEEWCIRLGDTRLTADPTHPKYREFLRRQTHRLLAKGKGGFNADGFKIDQLSHTPSRIHPRSSEQFGRTPELKGTANQKISMYRDNQWGCELLLQLQRDIYDAAKNAKSDCLITSSTVHPYFRDTFDMVRIHDTGDTDTDVYAAMKLRCDLSRAALPEFPIDTDNWIHGAYDKWLDYTCRSHTLGVPCIFYSTWFPETWYPRQSAREIPMKDLRNIGRIWKKYVQ